MHGSNNTNYKKIKVWLLKLTNSVTLGQPQMPHACIKVDVSLSVWVVLEEKNHVGISRGMESPLLIYPAN